MYAVLNTTNRPIEKLIHSKYLLVRLLLSVSGLLVLALQEIGCAFQIIDIAIHSIRSSGTILYLITTSSIRTTTTTKCEIT